MPWTDEETRQMVEIVEASPSFAEALRAHWNALSREQQLALIEADHSVHGAEFDQWISGVRKKVAS